MYGIEDLNVSFVDVAVNSLIGSQDIMNIDQVNLAYCFEL